MGILATYLPNPRCVARLEAAVGSMHTVRNCNSWATLEKLCIENAVDIAVVDLYGDGTANFDAVRRLRAQFGTITLIAYVAFAPDRARDLFDLGRAGAVGLLLTDLDDRPRAIRAILERAEARGTAAEMRRMLTQHTVVVRDAVMVAVTRAHERLNGDRLADVVGVSRRSLASELKRVSFPPPSKLVTWGRLMVAGQLLGDRERSADAVARTLGFPSGSAFRNTCQRYLGLKPTEVRKAGGAKAVVERFFAAKHDDDDGDGAEAA
ncbi:MAG TPA: AraC family transcriptional regulator [Gemmatimonadaceae bacterium]|nr:AraC family transcriptional regulator [Gemmatimonadaceae bacterium]